jgi:hypothetical protein
MNSVRAASRVFGFRTVDEFQCPWPHFEMTLWHGMDQLSVGQTKIKSQETHRRRARPLRRSHCPAKQQETTAHYEGGVEE